MKKTYINIEQENKDVKVSIGGTEKDLLHMIIEVMRRHETFNSLVENAVFFRLKNEKDITRKDERRVN